MPNNKIGCLGAILKFIGLLPADFGQELPYGLRDDFLSYREKVFYRVLCQAAGNDVIVFTKVSLADIFFVKVPDQNLRFYNKISRKHVDYLLCDPQTLDPVAGVELDDSSHDREDRIERDIFIEEVFETAGLPLIRIRCRNEYSVKDIREEIEAAIEDMHQRIIEDASENKSIERDWEGTPLCPRCGVPMVLRTVARGSNRGRQFYGCSNYPRCKQTVNLK